MNQSNKALRDEVAKMLVPEVTQDIHSAPRVKERELIHLNDCLGLADEILALVTNHIKGRMPKKFSNAAMTTNETNAYGAGWNHCLDEVSQLINELEQKETTDGTSNNS